MSATDIVIVIGAISLGVVNAITAWRVGSIQKSVNGAASASVAKIDALEMRITTLLADKAETKQIASLLAQAAVRPKDL